MDSSTRSLIDRIWTYFWEGGIRVRALYCAFWETVFVGLIAGWVKIINE